MNPHHPHNTHSTTTSVARRPFVSRVPLVPLALFLLVVLSSATRDYVSSAAALSFTAAGSAAVERSETAAVKDAAISPVSAAWQATATGAALNPRLGITFISSADHPADERRYSQALLLGAGWNRFPFYWGWIEPQPGTFDYARYDRVVQSDLAHGLQINAILLGIPDPYRSGASITDLGAPVFSDETDTPAPGKTINPNNPWARFVYTTVQRYTPAITVWEVWNEPDFAPFWTGGAADYVRMLKVAWLAAHHANPDAQVMFGGLAYTNPEADDFLAAALALIAADPARDAHNWYFDLVGVHNYSNPWRSGWVVRRVQQNLARYGLTRPVWLNESGVPVWDDYPGPTWTAADPASRRLRATMQQQAAFVVQSTAYAWASGAQVVFYHQLYDDCGNQPAGTDFPPHDGSLCASGACWGDAHGLFRNERSNVCFRQSSLPGTPRPAASAFHLMATAFKSPFSDAAVLNVTNQGVVIAFNRPQSGERLYVMWNTTADPLTLEVPADGATATLYTIGSEDYVIAPDGDRYRIGLPAATRDDYPFLAPGAFSAIGGVPFVMVESLTDPAAPINPALVNLEPFTFGDTRGGGLSGVAPVGGQIFPTPGAVIPAAPPPNAVQPAPPVIPANTSLRATPVLPVTLTAAPVGATPVLPVTPAAPDTTPPVPFMLGLPVVSPPTFNIAWGARDTSAIAAYVVFVRENGGEWRVWQDATTATQAQFTGTPGTRYEFAVWAQDAAGNWSANTDLIPLAETAVQ